MDYDPSEFPPFAVTVDVVILTMSEGRCTCCSCAAARRRLRACGRFPAASSGPDETLDEAAMRELREETGVDAASPLPSSAPTATPSATPA